MYRIVFYTSVLSAIIWISCGQGETGATGADQSAAAAAAPRTDTLLQAVSAEEMILLFQKYPNMPRIDLRTAAEYKEGHIVRSINWQYYGKEDDCLMRLMSLDRKTPVMIYHTDHERVRSIGQMMVQNGFNDVFFFKNGMYDWFSAGQVFVLN